MDTESRNIEMLYTQVWLWEWENIPSNIWKYLEILMSIYAQEVRHQEIYRDLFRVAKY